QPMAPGTLQYNHIFMRAFIYSLKVWKTSIFVSPLLIVFITKLQVDLRIDEANSMFVGGIILGFLFSIPSFMLLWIATYLVTHTHLKWGNKKTLLSFLSVALVLLAFSLYGRLRGLPRGEACLIAVYSIVAVTSIWLYKLKLGRTKKHL
ncbi:MAG: hypothetical protein ABIN95_02870, partial [Mucilaginibacter sp.]